MKRVLALAGVCAALAFPAAASAHPATMSTTRHLTLVPAKTCSAGYKKGTINGVVKCLRAGEYCSIKYKKQYVKYGFTCSGSPARLHKR